MQDQFEWDQAKNHSNFAKHGIRFEEAVTIFEGPVLTGTDQRFAYGEQRQISFGLLGETVVLTVVHTDRHGRTRIISARRASRSERNAFYVYIENTLGRN